MLCESCPGLEKEDGDAIYPLCSEEGVIIGLVTALFFMTAVFHTSSGRVGKLYSSGVVDPELYIFWIYKTKAQLCCELLVLHADKHSSQS